MTSDWWDPTVIALREALQEARRQRDQARAWACEGQERLAEVARLLGEVAGTHDEPDWDDLWWRTDRALAVAEGAAASTETTT